MQFLAKVEYISFPKIKEIVDARRPMLLVRYKEAPGSPSKFIHIFERNFLGTSL